jgi:hypothetical protein
MAKSSKSRTLTAAQQANIEAMKHAMALSSPAPSPAHPQKRLCKDRDKDDNPMTDDEHGDISIMQSTGSNKLDTPVSSISPLHMDGNMKLFVWRLGQAKRLEAEQVEELKDLVMVCIVLLLFHKPNLNFYIQQPLIVQDAKILAKLFIVKNDIATICISQPAYEPTAALTVCLTIFLHCEPN